MTGNNGFSKPLKNFQIVGSKMEAIVEGFKQVVEATSELDGMGELELTMLLQVTERTIADLCDKIEPIKTELRKLESWRTDLVDTKWNIQRKLIPVKVITSKRKPKEPTPLTEDDIILYRDYSTSQLITMLGKEDALKLIKRGRHHNY